MRKIVSVLSAAVLTLALCACSSGSSTSSITVAGSTTCLPIAEIAAEGFKEETGTDVLVSGLAHLLASKLLAPAPPISPAPLVASTPMSKTWA